MIDSVLKGTGNSRFLKSAVPAGTSWADALAMLQAGTFPIDFNGINAEGFQQVGTPLNKANLLKDATAAQIGLPPSTTPDGMFQALGNTGELHVWRKTVVTTEPVQAGYTIGEKISLSNNRAVLLNGNGADTISVSSSISVDENSGKVTLGDSIVYSIWNTTANIQGPENQIPVTELAGKYFVINKGVSYPNIPSNLAYDTVYYIPQNATCGYDYNWVTLTDLRLVNGHPYIPAGTTTTYPVSTNPNAYQEGDDAKEAGYVLEAAKQMVAFKTTNSNYKYYAYNYADSISVSDNGTVSLVGELKASGRPFQTNSFNAAKGKFCQFIIEDWFDGYVSTEITGIVFIPSDAVFDVTTLQVTCSNVQPVTGYAAIPAGTTIEYLGKLGDKARVQVVSYVGTGTYGKDNKNQLTFSGKPRFVMVPGAPFGYAYIPNGNFYYANTGDYITLEDLYCDWNDDTNTMTWYHTSYPYRQYNESGKKYAFVAIY